MKYNKREIMKRAWEIRKSHTDTKTGVSACTMSYALTQAWAEAKAAATAKTVKTLTAERLTAKGGKLWEKGAHRRVYFNRAELSTICSKEIEDAKATSNRYGRMVEGVVASGVYFDLNACKFCGKGEEYAVKCVIDRLAEYVAA